MSNKKNNDFLKNLEKKLKNQSSKFSASQKRKQGKNNNNKNSNNKWPLLILIMVSVALWLTFISLENGKERQESSYSDFYNYTQQGVLKSCVVIESESGNRIEYEIDGVAYYTQIPNNLSALEINELLKQQNVEIAFKHKRESQLWLILLQLLPWLIFIFIIFFFLSPIRNMRGGGRWGSF